MVVGIRKREGLVVPGLRSLEQMVGLGSAFVEVEEFEELQI